MYPYQDKDLAIEQRIEDLLARMTVFEKVLQTDQYYSYDFTVRDEHGVAIQVDMQLLDEYMKGNSVGSVQLRGMNSAQANQVQRYAVENTRLGIPFLFSEEALHGLMAAKSTSFPQQIGLAATFNPALGRAMGRGIATEARACGIHETYSPVMDLMRDPRFGRCEETYGEDVHLSSEFAREVVLGLQGEGLAHSDAVAAEPKHYVGYGNPVGGLNCAPSTMGRHDVFAECLPVFEAAFKEGGATNAMCSYNAIDSLPVSMDRELLTDVLRGQFGMPGFVRSDMTAVSRLYDWHFITPSRREAIRLGLEAGVDLQLYDFPHEEWQQGIAAMVEDGSMKMETLDEACRRVLRVKFMLGLFENPYIDESLENKVMRCDKHRQTALEIARQSICLLKNREGLLPLSKEVSTIAVLGPAADKPAYGDYTETRGRKGAVTVLKGIRSLLPNTEVLYEQGCNFLGDAITPFHAGMLEGEDGLPGLTARYYNGDRPEGTPVVTRQDLVINFNWIYAKPHPDLEANCFSVAWTGYVKMPETLEGCIGLGSQDSMRLYVDGNLLIDGWGSDKNSSQMVDFVFEAGKKYPVKIEFTNDQRGARVMFGYNAGREDFSAAVAAAKKAEVAIVCVGDNEETSGENFDRVSLDLPGRQLEFVKAVYQTGTPVVLVMQSGRPVSCNWEQEHLPAILQAWFPGEQGGYAIAQTLFGDNSPSGRLPVTYPRAVGQIPCHYSRKPGGGQRYVEMNWLPLYPFGYGLSYTDFKYTDFALSATEIRPGEALEVSLNVTNTGKTKGTAVPQVYLRDCFSSMVKPRKELAAFCKVELEPGETSRVSLKIGERQMRTLTVDYRWVVEPGDFLVMAGDNAENTFWEQSFTVLPEL